MSATETGTGKMKGILTDVTKCIGCERCVEACCEVNKLPAEFVSRQQMGDGLSGRRFTAIVPVKSGGHTFTVRKQCLHCLEPTCAAACLVGAFTKTADGAVKYDAAKCIGCRYCMLACPFGIPRYEWDALLPYIRKCRMDEQCRVSGGAPACVTACPTGATIFGNREELLEEARRRLEKDPGKYFNRIWGDKDFGGTSVMYISPVDLGPALGFPKDEELESRAVAMLEERSIKHMVEPWVFVTPVQFGVVSTSLFGIWLLRRRSLLMNKGPHGRGGPGSPGEQTAGFDEVCHVDEPQGHGGKEGK